jgi:cell division protein ZapA
MVAKNVVQVEIFGHTYTIRGEANQEYILEVAAYVDRKMREITEKLPVASLSKVAILASLNIADELFKERARREDEERDLRDLSSRTARLSAVLDDVIQKSGTP